MIRFRYRHWFFHLPLLRNYRAICLGHTVYFKHAKADIPPSLLRHELVHQEQIAKLGIDRFYVSYLASYFRNLIKYRNHEKAYREIPFEAEAFLRESESGLDAP